MIGLGFASMPGAAGNVTVIGGLWTLLMWLAFLSADGHLQLFGSIVAAQGVMPPGGITFERLAAYGTLMFAGGLRLALPIIGVLLLGNLLVAIATRSAPQLGAMAIGPAALLLGFVWALPLLLEGLNGRAIVTLNAAFGLL
jgi:flagellar biosynthetic protein FliR